MHDMSAARRKKNFQRWYVPRRRKNRLCARSSRSAVLELCRLLAGENSTLRVRAGDAEKLRSTRYILTLDADTRLEPESAGELIGAALHPLNRPAVDPKRGIVFRGHGVLHPRIAVSLESAYRNDFGCRAGRG